MNLLRSISAWFIGIAFMVILFPLTFVVWLLVLPFDSNRSVIHWMLIRQSILISHLLPVWSLKISGREKALKKLTYVIISNHQSLIDILLINNLGLRFKWVSKIENTRVPVLGWYLRMADYLVVDRANDESKAEMLAKSYAHLKNGTSVMIFPEGTRSGDMQTGYFKRGAFELAIRAKLPVLPVVIHGTGGILPKNGMVIKNKKEVEMRVLDPVFPEAFGTNVPEELAAKFRDLIDFELSKIEKG